MRFRGESLALADLAMATIGLATDCARSDSGQTPDPKTRIQLLREATAEAQGAGQQNPNAITVRQSLTEQLPEPGWNRFRSPLFPYQTYVPPGWIATSEKRYDHFFGGKVGYIPTHVIITVEDLKQPIPLEDYRNQTRDRMSPAAIDAPSVSERKVGGLKAWMIEVNLSGLGTVIYNNRVVLIKGSQVWEITLETDGSVSQRELPNFQKMLAHLTFT